MTVLPRAQEHVLKRLRREEDEQNEKDKNQSLNYSSTQLMFAALVGKDPKDFDKQAMRESKRPVRQIIRKLIS